MLLNFLTLIILILYMNFFFKIKYINHPHNIACVNKMDTLLLWDWGHMEDSASTSLLNGSKNTKSCWGYRAIGMQIQDFERMPTFSIKKMYIVSRGKFPEERWSKLICNNIIWKLRDGFLFFILSFMIDYRQGTELLNKKISTTWHVQCVMYIRKISIIYFFTVQFQVSSEKSVDKGVMKQPQGWFDEIHWATENACSDLVKSHIYRMNLVAGVYYIWKERNCRVFQQRHNSLRRISNTAIREVFCRGGRNKKLVGKLDEGSWSMP